LDPLHPRDVLLAMPPTHYMEYDSESKKYTSRFHLAEIGGSVLGANAIMGHDVLFDVENDRIGWAESDCDYTHLLTENGYTFDLDDSKREDKPGGGGGGTSPTPAKSAGSGNSKPAAATGTEEDVGITDVFNDLIEACDTLSCRISAGVGLFSLFCVGCCMARCFCSGSSDHAGEYQQVAMGGIGSSEVEMSSNGSKNGHFGSYKDKPAVPMNGNGNGKELDADAIAEFAGDFTG
jgi:hypothetical protein